MLKVGLGAVKLRCTALALLPPRSPLRHRLPPLLRYTAERGREASEPKPWPAVNSCHRVDPVDHGMRVGGCRAG